MKKFLLTFFVLALATVSVHAETSSAPYESEQNITSQDSAIVSESEELPVDDVVPVVDELPVDDEIPKIEAKPDTPVDIYIYGNFVTLPRPARFDDGTVTIPLLPFLENMISASEFSYEQDEDNTVTVKFADKKIVLTIGSNTAMFNDKEITLSSNVYINDGFVYAPLRALCEYFGYEVKARWFDNILAVYTNYPSPKPVAVNSASYVNSAGLSSNTPYLIWINKDTFTLHVFLGNSGNWNEVYSCKCAIGANSSPTINGTFKFYSLESRWNYDKFYVGPIMRFYGGYAIHTTLLKYDGSDYNATVGKKLSHGCVRVRPADMTWLVDYVPKSTTIHITGN